MAVNNLQEDTHKLCKFIHQKLEEQGYHVESNVALDKTEIDLLAIKDGKSSAIEVKTTKEGVLSSIPNLIKLKILPEVDRIYIAAPEDVLTKDIHTIAKYGHIGIGLITVADDEIKWSLKSQETTRAELVMVSYDCVSSVVLGETFNIKLLLGNRGGKISKKIQVECTPLGPFKPISERTQKISKLPPTERKSVNFRFRVNDEVDSGRYFMFVKWVDQIKQESTIIDIEVHPRSSEYIERLVAGAIVELNRVVSRPVDYLLGQINNAVEKGYLNVEDHIYDKSIWNTLGAAYLNHGLLKQAEQVYRNMLKTLEKYEVAHAVKIHKGLAFHNLGIILYHQRRRIEAKDMLLNAFEEDKRTYGPEKASKGQAKKTLDELNFSPIS